MLKLGCDIWMEEEALFAALEAVASATKDVLNGVKVSQSRLSWTGHVLKVNGKEEAIADAVSGIITEHLTSKVRAKLVSSVDGNHLQTVVAAWSEFKSMLAIIRVCSCVTDYAQHLFYEDLLSQEDLRGRVGEAMITAITADRRGEDFDEDLVKRAAQVIHITNDL